MNIRPATPKDIPVIKKFIIELAQYEHLSGQVKTTEEALMRALFKEEIARALIAEEDGLPIGYAIFFYTFSSFLCSKGIFIEDIYISPDMRGRGFGRQIFKYLANIAKKEDCGRMEWNCLSWNSHSIGFYQSLDAKMLSGWRLFRLDGTDICRLAE